MSLTGRRTPGAVATCVQVRTSIGTKSSTHVLISHRNTGTLGQRPRGAKTESCQTQKYDRRLPSSLIFRCQKKRQRMLGACDDATNSPVLIIFLALPRRPTVKLEVGKVSQRLASKAAFGKMFWSILVSGHIGHFFGMKVSDPDHLCVLRP